MKNKLFILGWDNALVSDIVENKVHPAYLAMLAEVDPNLHARWTLDDTVSMQGEQPEKIWQSFCELLGDEKGRRAREIFYQTYRRLPLPPLTENALPFLRKLNACGCVVAVVSNKTQKILEEEIRMRKLDGLIDIAIGTTEKEEPQAFQQPHRVVERGDRGMARCGGSCRHCRQRLCRTGLCSRRQPF